MLQLKLNTPNLSHVSYSIMHMLLLKQSMICCNTISSHCPLIKVEYRYMYHNLFPPI